MTEASWRASCGQIYKYTIKDFDWSNKEELKRTRKAEGSTKLLGKIWEMLVMGTSRVSGRWATATA